MKKIFSRYEIYIFFVLILLITVITCFNRSFFTLENFMDLLRGHTWVGLLTIGFLVVLISGGIDVSFTAIAVTGAYLATKVLFETGINNILFAFLISCFVGIILGAINASLISFFKIPSLIATLATLTIYTGALVMYSGFIGTTYWQSPPSAFENFGKAYIFKFTNNNGTVIGLSNIGLILIIIALITWLILKYTMIGRSIYILGGNIDAAKRIGLNIVKINFFVYCYAGFLAGMAGIIYESMQRSLGATNIVGGELNIIAAVVLGGASLTGGKGSIIGTMLGLMVLTITQTSLVIIKIPTHFTQAVIGLIIIISVSITTYQQNVKEKQSRILFQK